MPINHAVSAFADRTFQSASTTTRSLGRNGVVWIAVTLLIGSFGPLLCLLSRPRTSSRL